MIPNHAAMAVAAELDLGRVDAIYHGGDISYATGYLAVWDFYMEMMGPVTGSVVYLTTVGNHESDYPSSPSYYQGTDSGGECSVLTTKLMPMPYPAETNQPWWSYDTGLIHMIGLSTEHDYTTGSPQWEWLKADLQSINRTKTPWVIFGGHRAMYINSNYECMGENSEYCGPDVPCTQVDNPDDYAPDDYITCDATEVPSPTDSAVQALLIKHIEPLLYQFKVDIGFYGHNHAVQRHSAVFNNTVLQASTLMYDDNGRLISSQVDPPCTIHMVVGTAGAFFTKNAMEPAPEWNELYFYEYGYAKVEATSPLELTWNWVNSETNEIMDTLVIKRTNSNPNQPPSTDGNSDDMTDGEIAAAVVCSILGFAFVASFIYFQFFRSKGQGQQQNEAPSDVFSPLGNGPRVL
jgi:acid phosphatase type 7